MSAIDLYDLAVLGSGEAGKYLAWTLSKAGQRTALVERSMVGGSCPNVACLPSKNIIHSAKVASLARRGAEFGLELGSMSTKHGRRPRVGNGAWSTHSSKCTSTATRPAESN